MAEAARRGHAADADDQGRFAACTIIRIAVARIEKYGIETLDRVQVARMHAEKHTRLHIELVFDHVVFGHIESEKRFLGREEVFFRRCHRGGIIKHHVVGVFDHIENVALAVCDRGYKFV